MFTGTMVTILVLLLSLVVSCVTTDTVFSDISEQGCGNNPADIIFVLDGSASIYPPHFQQQLNFVQDVIGDFDVGFNKTHIGVITFSSKTHIVFPLGKFTEKEQLKRAVNATKQDFGQTYTHLALKITREVFSSKFSRPWVRHVAIVITDGDPDDKIETVKEAGLLHAANIETFAIGVGKSVNRSQLETIASSAKFVFPVDSYAALKTLRSTLSWIACPEPTTTTTTTTTEPPRPPIKGCSGNGTMDNIWALPNQADVDTTNYALNFIQSVTNEMELGPYHVQVGLVPRFCDKCQEIRLKDHDTKEGFWNDLNGRRLFGLRTDRALEYMRTQGFKLENGNRPEAVKYGIIIADNPLEKLEETLNEADLARKNGIELIVIGIGSKIHEDELRRLASAEKDYIHANSYFSLIDVKNTLITRFCEAITRKKFRLRNLFEDFYQ